MNALVVEFGASEGDASAGEAAFGFGDAGFLFGVIEEDDDLVLFDSIAFFDADPFHHTLEARADLDAFAVDDVAGDGEGVERWRGGVGFGFRRGRLRNSGGRRFWFGGGFLADDAAFGFGAGPGVKRSDADHDKDDDEDGFHRAFGAAFLRGIDLQLGEFGGIHGKRDD